MSEPILKTTVSPEFFKLVEKVSAIVHKISGNKLGEKQAFMIETRVRKRMLELGIKQPDEYLNYVDHNLQKESGVLVGLITTHHTFFFREFSHFELLKKYLPEFAQQAKTRGDKTIRIWSAACSRGQEVYSLGMFLEFYLPQIDPTISYQIYGTDIDDESVKIAANGVYHSNEIKEVPMNFLGNHWAKGTGDIAMYAKIKDTIKKKCQFKVGNLMNVPEIFPNLKFDAIFCRNVFIYFEQGQIEKICNDLNKQMYNHSIFFSGISESLTGYKVEFNSIGPSAYKNKSAIESNPIKPMSTTATTSRPEIVPMRNILPSIPEVIRVLCVDDSQSIHTLLKKLLTKENGFEIVGHAMNGKDAMEKMKAFKVDVVTLDIHMPEMDGIQYLEKNYNSSHPPVVMISSASREDADTAMKALRLGASDFVEKPSLQNMEEKGEEIRTKLKTVVSDRVLGIKVSSIDIENSKKIVIDSPKNYVRVMTMSISDLKKLKEVMKHTSGEQPPTFVIFEGQDEVLPSLINEYKKDFKHKINYYDGSIKQYMPNEFYFCDSKKWGKEIQEKTSSLKKTVMCFGVTSKYCADYVLNFKDAQLLLEDLGEKQNKKSPLYDVATDCVPVTSFLYMSNVFLTKK